MKEWCGPETHPLNLLSILVAAREKEEGGGEKREEDSVASIRPTLSQSVTHRFGGMHVCGTRQCQSS